MDRLNIILLESGTLVAQRLKRLPPMWETWVRSLGQEDPLEKEMAIRSSILAWRIPWTEKPGRLQSTGSQRVMTEQLHLHLQCICNRSRIELDHPAQHLAPNPKTSFMCPNQKALLPLLFSYHHPDFYSDYFLLSLR